MSYYTTVSVNLSVKPDKIEAFQQCLEEIRNVTDSDSHWFRCYNDLSVDEEGNLQFEEDYRRWYDGERFYNLVKEFVDGGDITGYGEEFEDYWRIVFDGCGGWKRQKPVFVDEESDPKQDAATP